MHSDLHHDDGLSRREIRERKFLRRAKAGNFGADIVLFLSEEKVLRKKGFLTVRYSSSKKGSVPSHASWEDAFKNGVPAEVTSYITGQTGTFPKTSNLAQELYVIASRANFQKGKKAQATGNE